VQSQVVRAGAKPIVKRARQLAPRSTNAPAGPYRDRRSNRDKRSKKQRGEADWDYPLWKTIKQVVRKGKFASLAVIGPEWPKGNKEHFNTSPGGRRQVLWGTHTGKIVPQIRNWIVQAFDETRPQQLLGDETEAQTVDGLQRLEIDKWLMSFRQFDPTC
jgi:hypothetical protein